MNFIMNYTTPNRAKNNPIDNSGAFLKSLGSLLLVASFAVAIIPTEVRAQEMESSYAQNRSSMTFPTPHEVLQEGLNPHVDLMMGLASPEGSYNTGAEYGFGFGFQPYAPFDLGMSLTYSSNAAKHVGDRRIERTNVLVRGTYNFGGEIPVVKFSHIGIATGPLINQDAMYFAFAPIIGFDIPIQEWIGEYVSYVTIGAEAKYLMVSSKESDALTVNGALKYWF